MFQMLCKLRVHKAPICKAENCIFQLRVVAVDGGTPAKSSTAIVDITVTRNLREPQFRQDMTRVSINDNSPPGMLVAQVQARDEDRGVRIRRPLIAN